MRTPTVLAILLFCSCARPQQPTPIEAGDYTFMWWAHGWRGRSPAGEQIMCVQTGRYGMAVDIDRAAPVRLGAIAAPLPYREAAAEENDIVLALPEPSFSIAIENGGKRYTFAGGARDRGSGGFADKGSSYPVRIIESGRFFQRMDILDLAFAAADGDTLPAAGRLEFACWPDRAGFILDLVPGRDLADMTVTLSLEAGGRTWSSTRTFPAPAAGERHETALAWAPGNAGIDPSPTLAVTVTDPADSTASVPVTWDAARGWFIVDMPERSWSVTDEPDRLDRLMVAIDNPGVTAQTVRLNFAFDGGFPGITGMSPMLRDESGIPSGIPVQISKNWHGGSAHPLYEGPWFHGLTMIRVPPRGGWRGEFDLAYSRWGGVPAASHAQLCLVGWGTNQLWEQVAIGSWGESICYDPDVNLTRSIIDDIRPLMVWAMRDQPAKWDWTNNVGGGDFLVYYDAAGVKQYLTRMRTQYERYGPCLTEVTYAGVSGDGRIAARLTVMTPRTDDINRSWHHFRYDVLEPVAFTRLSFYQAGSDRYNDHNFDMLARGNADGLAEEWQAARGGLTYHQTGMPCEGEAPWFALFKGSSARPDPRGAWADRGIVIRSWKARLGGKDVPPYAASYGTEDQFPSANIEIVPPPDVTALLPGDYVEATVEFLVLPQSAADYYGPNENLRAHLAAHGGTWEPMQRQAAGNNLRLAARTGNILRSCPPVIAVKNDRADITVEGGLAWVPLTFSGLSTRTGLELVRMEDGREVPVDQTVQGNDFWQTEFDPASGTYAVTYNVNLDTPGDKRRTARFVLRVK